MALGCRICNRQGYQGEPSEPGRQEEMRKVDNRATVQAGYTIEIHLAARLEQIGLRHNGGELAAAIEKGLANTVGSTLVEGTIDRNDWTRELLEWRTRIAAANSRPQQCT